MYDRRNRLQRTACSGGNPVGKRFVVPEGGILENEPPSRFADATPAFSPISMASDPAWSVQVVLKAKFLQN